MLRATVTGLLFAVLAMAGCDAVHQDYFPKALIEVPGGFDLSLEERAPGWEIFYRVNDAYPAERVLSHIKTELATEGWSPLKEDFMNPGLPSSHATGWGSFLDATTSPHSTVKQWLGQWLNNDGDVVWYTLQYRYAEGASPDLETVTVSGIYIPGHIADAIREDQPSNPLTNSSSGRAGALR